MEQVKLQRYYSQTESLQDELSTLATYTQKMDHMEQIGAITMETTNKLNEISHLLNNIANAMLNGLPTLETTPIELVDQAIVAYHEDQYSGPGLKTLMGFEPNTYMTIRHECINVSKQIPALPFLPPYVFFYSY